MPFNRPDEGHDTLPTIGGFPATRQLPWRRGRGRHAFGFPSPLFPFDIPCVAFDSIARDPPFGLCESVIPFYFNHIAGQLPFAVGEASSLGIVMQRTIRIEPVFGVLPKRV